MQRCSFKHRNLAKAPSLLTHARCAQFPLQAPGQKQTAAQRIGLVPPPRPQQHH